MRRETLHKKHTEAFAEVNKKNTEAMTDVNYELQYECDARQVVERLAEQRRVETDEDRSYSHSLRSHIRNFHGF